MDDNMQNEFLGREKKCQLVEVFGGGAEHCTRGRARSPFERLPCIEKFHPVETSYFPDFSESISRIQLVLAQSRTDLPWASLSVGFRPNERNSRMISRCAIL